MNQDLKNQRIKEQQFDVNTLREHNIKMVQENYNVKADKTYGMNTFHEMDEVESKNPKFPPTQKQQKITKKLLEQGRREDAEERMSQLADRIETNSFQG